MINKRVKNNRVPLQVVLLSLIVAFFVDIKPINMIFVSGNSIDQEDSGFMALLYPLTFFLLLLTSLFSKRIKWNFNSQVVFLLIYLLLFYGYTDFFIGPPRTRLPLLLAFVLCALVIPCITMIDTKYFLRGLMFFPSFAIFRLDTVFSSVKDWTDAISMDASYAFLIPIIASIVYIKTYLKFDDGHIRKVMLVLCLINSIFFAQLFLHGSRGPLLSIFLLLLFLFTIRKKEDASGVGVLRGKASFVLIGLLIFFSGYILIFNVIIDMLSVIGVESHALVKILDLESSGDVSNGRAYLNTLTLNGIWESPIFGNGFDRYHANTNNLYPHNFILQILYDGGILYFFIIITPVVMGLIRLFKKCNNDEFAMITVLMFASVPGALFSNNLYASSILWLFFGFTLSKSFIYKPKLLKSK